MVVAWLCPVADAGAAIVGAGRDSRASGAIVGAGRDSRASGRRGTGFPRQRCHCRQLGAERGRGQQRWLSLVALGRPARGLDSRSSYLDH